MLGLGQAGNVQHGLLECQLTTTKTPAAAALIRLTAPLNNHGTW